MRPRPRRSSNAARPSSASGGCAIALSPTASRKPATACSPSHGCRQVSGEAREQRTRSSVCTKSSSGGSRRRPCCRRQKRQRCCSGRCSPLVRSTCARLMVGRRSPQSPSISRLTSPPDRILSKCRRSRHRIPTPLATAPALLLYVCPASVAILASPHRVKRNARAGSAISGPCLRGPNLLLRMSVSRRNGLYPKSRAFKGNRSGFMQEFREELGHDGQLGTVDRIAELLYCWCAPQMEDAMCYAKDYKVYDDQKKAEDTQIVQERRAGLIDRLLNAANKPGEKTKSKGTPVKEVAPAK